MTDVPTWLELLDRYGFPVVFNAIVLLGVWQLVRWIKPMIAELVTTHIAFVKRTDALLEASVQEQKAQGVALNKLADDMRETRKETTRMAENIVDRLDKLVEKSA